MATKKEQPKLKKWQWQCDKGHIFAEPVIKDDGESILGTCPICHSTKIEQKTEKRISMSAKTKAKDKSKSALQTVFDMFDGMHTSAIAAAYVCMRISKIDSDFADKIMKQLEADIDLILKGEETKWGKLDTECDVEPVIRWTTFLNGYLCGVRTFGPKELGRILQGISEK